MIYLKLAHFAIDSGKGPHKAHLHLQYLVSYLFLFLYINGAICNKLNVDIGHRYRRLMKYQLEFCILELPQ